MNMVAKEDEVKSILDVEYHARLLADIDNVSARARIPSHMLHMSVTKYCNKNIVRWLKNWQERMAGGKAGMCLTGIPAEVGIGDQLMAITALFVRHYIDARFIVLNRLLDGMGTENEENPTVLVVPDLYVEGQGAKGNTNFQQQDVYGFLLERFSKGKASIIYIQDIDKMRLDYGPVIADHYASSFDVIQIT